MKSSESFVQVNNDNYDVVVIGAGHAGCEAALASARLGCRTLMITINIESVAMMPCNPNIGGTSKGHLVREIDALGGEMGRIIDQSFIQSKMLNKSKGPAVHSLRAQADKELYHLNMLNVIEQQENLTLLVGEASEILTEDNNVYGIVLKEDRLISCRKIVLCTGTYLKARCVHGNVSEENGPAGLKASTSLSDSLVKNGISIKRYKTGTPARILKSSIDFSCMEEQLGDEVIIPFSFTTNSESIQIEQESCWLTYTNENTHEIIRNNLDRSPLFSGFIEGTGPRYCPSIEDKVVRFPDKNRHQVFLEPEGLNNEEMYVGGMSSSLPEDVQKNMYRSVRGLEHAIISKYAYAIEYDCIEARQLSLSLEFKKLKGLYSAGQFNGSSGYEEAAAQGLIAGINAARSCYDYEPIIIDRSQGYIGVLIDDLVTKESHEPYRMMTSRSEYRLLLRQDNADQRLTPLGYEIGLISKERYEKLQLKIEQIQKEIERLNVTTVGNGDAVQNLLKSLNSTPLKSGTTLAELLKRPEISYHDLASIDQNRPNYTSDVTDEVVIHLKYDGYIKRQQKQVNEFKRLERRKIPGDIDYSIIHNLRTEAIQKLTYLKPETIGQASRISGVSPSDISVLIIYLETMKGIRK